MRLKELIRNFSYTIFSNFISLAISSLVVLIIPRFIGIKAYGYWQLYIFYTTYVGVLHFGWLDGIYLRYGGAKYEKLNMQLFHSQFIQLALMQLIMGVIIGVYAINIHDTNMTYIFIMTAVAMILINVRQFFLYILQDTARIEEYAIVSTIGRVVYFIIILLLLFIHVKNYKLFIVADIIGRLLSMCYAFTTCKEIVFRKFSDFYWSFKETIINLSVGIKLLLANFADSLIIGVVRYGIQFTWGVKTFGKVSLTLNISNLLMTFINAISLVLYPTLRRMNQERLKQVYAGIREVLVTLLLIGLFLYYPISEFLPMWLPKYKSSLIYMALLFPMCIFSGKFSMLIVTFMKTFRLEKDLLKVNIISVFVSIVITIINVLFIKNLTVVMFSIVLILWIQSSLGEIILGNRIGVKTIYKVWSETLMVLIFMLSNWYLSFLWGLIIYTISIIVYLLSNRKKLKKGLIQLGAIKIH